VKESAPRVSRDLVEAFFRSAATTFAFLGEHDATSAQHLEIWDGTDWTAIRAADLPDNVFFLARGEYTGPGWRVRVEYGDREYLINTILEITDGGSRSVLSSLWNRFGRRPQPAGYSLWEWIEAVGGAAAGASHAGGADSAEQVTAAVTEMGDALRTYLSVILRDRATLIPRVRARRDQRMQEWKEQDRLDRDRRIAAEAAEAFRRRDFRRAVDLLEPLELRLSGSDRKKLDYARKRLPPQK
jgi:hypothetical protein